MKKPPETDGFSIMSIVTAGSDEHGADHETLGDDGDEAADHHLGDTHVFPPGMRQSFAAAFIWE